MAFLKAHRELSLFVDMWIQTTGKLNVALHYAVYIKQIKQYIIGQS